MQSTLRFALLAAAALSAASAQAQITNGDFSAGLTGWSSLGDVATRDGGAYLTNAALAFDDDEMGEGALNFSGTEVVPASDIEMTLSFPAGEFDPDTEGGTFALEGSLLYRDIVVQAGDVLSFSWSYFTNDEINDYAFVLFDALSFDLTSGMSYSQTTEYGYSFTTGTQIFMSAPASESRTVTFAVGVIDTSDFGSSSALMIDNVSIAPIPEPSAFAALAGLVGLGFAASRRRRA